MARIMGIVKWPVAVVIALVIIVMSGGSYWFLIHEPQHKNEAVDRLAQLPAPFVRDCQKIGTQFNLPWELLAGIGQIRVEKKLIGWYPGAEELVKLAVKMAPYSSDLGACIKQLGYPKELSEEIHNRTILLQTKSSMFSNSYSFPYKNRQDYRDTWGADREGGKRRHEGTDIFAEEGTRLYSVCDGKVEQLGWNRLGGERVGIRGQDGIYYYYAHLSKISKDLKVGMTVKRGTLLGYTGHTGDAINTPDHLHFGMELPRGKWINPYNFLRYWDGNP
jgi:peptidoglycan LD-endopeptidase LytH